MTRSIALALVTLGAAACGPKPAGKLPVSSPVYAFEAPDAEDLETPTDDVDDEPATDTATPDDSE